MGMIAWAQRKLLKSFQTLLVNPNLDAEMLHEYTHNTALRFVNNYDRHLMKPEIMNVLTGIVSHPKVSSKTIDLILRNRHVDSRLHNDRNKTLPQTNIETERVMYAFVEAVASNPKTDRKKLEDFALNVHNFDVVTQVLSNYNINYTELVKWLLDLPSPYKKYITEQFMIKKDGLEDWPTEWLESHYGRTLVKGSATFRI